MAYVALYRAYRPKSFREVAGQEHITRTLMNALKNDKVGHAYLFSGPRGTGKTSIAKIFAKAVNCLHAPIDDPCNECEICKGINNNTISDVIEIDAASNNSVDEIREIRDKVKYLPSICRYKVYIIDEVHMLSTSAFNALLKTLEEPPKHVIFILATTEVYKIPPTILSRCQRFDFRGISSEEISGKIKEIAKKEKIEIDDEAIHTIAMNAEGGMRDALSLLDQVVSFADGKITVNDVHKVSGSVAVEKLSELVGLLCNKKSSEAMIVLDDLLNEGKEIPRIIFDLITFFRNVLIFKNIKAEQFQLDVFKNSDFIEVAKSITNQRIYYYLDILNDTQNNIKWTNQKRAYVELAIIKMCDDLETKSVEDNELLYSLNKRVKQLEEKPIEVKVVKAEKPVVKPISYSTNVQMIESILNDCNPAKKELLLKGWVVLNKIDDPLTKAAGKLLYEASLEIASDFDFIITYDEEYKCQQIMKEQNKEAIRKILNRKTHLINDFVALTKDKYDILYTEYMNQKQSGISKPKLDNAKIDVEKEDVKVESDFISTTVDFFGKDKIKIEE